MKLRQAARDARRSELGQAHEAAAVLAKRESVLEDQLRGLKQLVRAATQPGRIDLERMIQAQRYEAVLKTELQVIDEQATRLAHEIERRRAAVVTADREVRVLEKLRDRQETRHRQKELKNAIKELADITGRCRTADEPMSDVVNHSGEKGTGPFCRNGPDQPSVGARCFAQKGPVPFFPRRTSHKPNRPRQ
jgi:flagellar export protein FliJ